MSDQSHFISCDWGTTNFRLRLIDRQSLTVLKEKKSNDGVKQLNDQAKRQGKTQVLVFEEFIMEQLAASFSEWEHVPMVCSGMLSSTLGIKELPYAKLPLKASGEGLVTENIILPSGKEFLLISGARGISGFMRGEEVQAIGLADQLSKEGVLILPGTHSKHLDFENDRFVEMRNFMTGELFSVLASHSILASAVQQVAWEATFSNPFLAGVELGMEDGISTHLLSVRSRQMFDHQSGPEGYFYLSGLLIGAELSYLSNHASHIYMAASDATFPLYQLALESFASADQLTLFNNKALREALFSGQRKILDAHGK